MTLLWIIDRDPIQRARLERGLAPFGTIVSAAPDDGQLIEGHAPDAIVLAADDLDTALDFADRNATRLPEARWLVLHDASVDEGRARSLFAGLDLGCLAWPSTPDALHRALLGLIAPRPLPLAARRRHQSLEAQARRFFQDLDLPILQAAHPSLDRLLVRGEPGTGRLLLVNLLHARSDDAAGPLLALPCQETTRPEDIAEAQSRRLTSDSSGAPITICLQDADRLSEATQRVLQGWIDLGGAPGLPAARFCATAGPRAGPMPGWPAGLAPESPLETALGHGVVELPPLRERSALIEPFTVLAVAEECARRGVSPPVLSEEALSALASHPWLGNLRELETVIARSLAALSEPRLEVLGAEDLALDGAPGLSAGLGLGGSREPDHLDLPDAEDALDALGGESLEAPAAVDPPRLMPLDPEPEEGTVHPTADEPPAQTPADASSEGSADESAASAPETASGADVAPLLPRLAGSMAHEVRNPLVTLRTFASLLPERYQDAEFRDEFRGQVLAEVDRIESLLDRLQELADVGSPKLTSVDATGLLEGLLEEHRPEIQRRRLLVLQELDPTRPLAIADPELLRLALASLLHRALAWVPERADLFVASKYHTVGRSGRPTVQILLRFYSPDQASPSPSDKARQALGLDATSIDVLFAEHLVALQHGSLRFEHGQPDETLVILDLPAV